MHQLVSRGHDVLVQAGAGEGSAISDAEYTEYVTRTRDATPAVAEHPTRVDPPRP